MRIGHVKCLLTNRFKSRASECFPAMPGGMAAGSPHSP